MLLLTFRASLVARQLRNPLPCRTHRFDPWVGKIPYRRKPTPWFLPGISMDRGAWWATAGLQESDAAYQLSRHHHQTFNTPHDLAATVCCNVYLHLAPYMALVPPKPWFS